MRKRCWPKWILEMNRLSRLKAKWTIHKQYASLVAQRLKRLPPMRETQVWSLGREDPLEKEMATHSSILAWRIPWTEEPGGLQSTGSQRVGHDWVTLLTLLTLYREGWQTVVCRPDLTHYLFCKHSFIGTHPTQFASVLVTSALMLKSKLRSYKRPNGSRS